MKRITESDMVFEFADEKVFQMEGSELHASVLDSRIYVTITPTTVENTEFYPRYNFSA